jgi:hypothetical protein
MTISSYRTDKILKSYRKQNKAKVGTSQQPDATEGAENADIATLDSADKTAVYDKISYSMVDVLLKSKKNKD